MPSPMISMKIVQLFLVHRIERIFEMAHFLLAAQFNTSNMQYKCRFIADSSNSLRLSSSFFGINLGKHLKTLTDIFQRDKILFCDLKLNR